MADVETLTTRFEADGHRQVVAAARQVENAVTRSMGKVNNAFGHLDARLTKLQPKLRGFTRDAQKLGLALAALQKAGDTNLRIHVTNTTQDIAGISNLAAAVARLRKVDGPINLHIRVNSLLQEIVQVERLAAAMRELKDQKVRVDVDQDSAASVAGGGRSRDVDLPNFGRGAKGIASIGVSAGAAAVKVTVLTGALLAAAAATHALTAATVGLAGGAATGAIAGLTAGALALGGAFAVAGAGVGAFAAISYPSLKQVTDAFKEHTDALAEANVALAAGDMEKYDKETLKAAQALGTLTPLQKATVENLRNFKNEWTATSRALEGTALGFVNSGLETLRSLLPSVVALAKPAGEALGNVFKKAQEGIEGAEFGRFIDVARKQTGPLIEQFGQVGFNLFGALAGGFVNGLPLVQDVMEGLVRVTDRLQAAMNGPGFASFVEFGVEMLPLLGDLFGSLGKAIGALLGGLEPLAAPALKVLTGLADGLAKAFSGAGMERFVANVEALLPILGETLGKFGGAIGKLLEGLSVMAPVVVKVLGGVADILSEAFSSDAAQTFVQNIMTALPLVLPILQTLVQTFLGVAAAVSGVLAPALTILEPAINAFGAAFVAMFEGVANSGLVEALAGLAGPFVNILAIVSQVTPAIATALVPVVEALGQALIDSTPHLHEMVDAVIRSLPAFTSLLVSIAPLIPALIEGLVPVLEASARQAEFLAPYLEDLAVKMQEWGPVIGDVVAVLGFFLGAVSAPIGFALQLKDTIDGLTGSMEGLFADAPSLLFDSGAAMIQSFIDGIVSKVDDVKGAVGGVLQHARDYFPNSPAKVGPFSGSGWVDQSGADTAKAFAAGFAGAAATMASTLSAGLTVGADALSLLALTPAAGAGAAAAGARTVVIPGSAYVVNGMTAATAPEGSQEQLLLQLLEQERAALIQGLNAIQSGGTI